MILGIHLHRRGDLPLVAYTGRLPGLLPRSGEDREQNSGQHGDDRDDDQQFDERETPGLTGGKPEVKHVINPPFLILYGCNVPIHDIQIPVLIYITTPYGPCQLLFQGCQTII